MLAALCLTPTLVLLLLGLTFVRQLFPCNYVLIRNNSPFPVSSVSLKMETAEGETLLERNWSSIRPGACRRIPSVPLDSRATLSFSQDGETHTFTTPYIDLWARAEGWIYEIQHGLAVHEGYDYPGLALTPAAQPRPGSQ